MFVCLLAFVLFYGAYFYFSYQVILLNDLKQIFAQTAVKAQEDLKGYSDLLLEDLGKCYPHVLLLVLASTTICFVWILLLKYNAKLIIWLSLSALPIIISVGLYFSIATYINLHQAAANGSLFEANGDDSFLSDQMLPFDQALQNILTAELVSYLRNDTLWLTISVILAIVLAALWIILLSLRERVRLSIALIRQASKAINGVKSTLVFPILPRTFGIATLAYGILISLLIISASHPTYRIVGGPDDGLPCRAKNFNGSSSLRRSVHQSSTTTAGPPLPDSLPQSSSVQFPGRVRATPTATAPPLPPPPPPPPAAPATSNNVSRLQPRCEKFIGLGRQHVWKYHAINIFATLWLLHFISGISQTTLAGAFASYYWAFRKPRDVPFFAVSASLYRVFRYHLGDIALGSFLIATVRYIRIVIEFIDNRIRRKGAVQDVATTTAQSAACFCRVFFWLLDRFLKYIDRNAYIMMSMYGEGYLQSAKRAVKLLYKNSTRALVLDYVTFFVLLVSRLLITGLAGYITALEIFTTDLHHKWLPVSLVVVATYFISKGLFSVYSMAVDTLFICFLIDSTNNDGSSERPYFMSKELRKIVKHNTVIS